MIKSCYIHIPFCNNICSYCDFCKVLYDKKYINWYLEALENEINARYKGEVLDTIYIGGGTPSSLEYDELEKLLRIVSSINRSPSYEYTIEVNFDSISFDKIDLLIKYGVNRISFGLETTNLRLLKFLNRSLDKDKVLDIISYCQKQGLTNINIDLMYALKNEAIEDLKEDLAFILKLDIPHISTYSLIIEKHTKLYIDKVKNINEELDLEMYNFICKTLKNHNYTHYEISNFAKDGYMSKHNLCYWNNLEYYGFGVGASGYIADIRYTNTRSITNYLHGETIFEREKLSFYDKIYYEVILKLRLENGINKTEFYKKYNVHIDDIYDYKWLVLNGLIIDQDEKIYIPKDKWYISNEILVKFLEGEKYE